MVASVAPVSSRKIADLPAGRVVTPCSGTAVASAPELSSTFQPVRSMSVVPVLVSSNQSAA